MIKSKPFFTDERHGYISSEDIEIFYPVLQKSDDVFRAMINIAEYNHMFGSAGSHPRRYSEDTYRISISLVWNEMKSSYVGSGMTYINCAPIFNRALFSQAYELYA